MIDVVFIDSGRAPTERPDPKHPNGVRVNLATASQKSCTAGRADDPSMITMPCKLGGLDA